MKNQRLERLWVGFLDSRRWREFRGSPVGQRLVAAPTFDRLDARRRRRLARAASDRHPGLFDDVDTVCLFIGHVKSGGTLLGAMIDAHPDAVIADEVDVLDHLAAGFEREELLHVLAKNSRREALKGRVTARRLGGYSLAIPGQWQGRFRTVRVIGESRGGPTTRRLGARSERIEQLRAFAAPARLRFIHVIRNPLDPIAAMVIRGGRSVEEACADYSLQARHLESVRKELPAIEYESVAYETLVAEPDSTLTSVLRYLGLDRQPGHSLACADLIDASRPGERTKVDWTPAQLAEVRRIAASHSFLEQYVDRIQVDDRPVETR